MTISILSRGILIPVLLKIKTQLIVSKRWSLSLLQREYSPPPLFPLRREIIKIKDIIGKEVFVCLFFSSIREVQSILVYLKMDFLVKFFSFILSSSLPLFFFPLSPFLPLSLLLFLLLAFQLPLIPCFTWFISLCGTHSPSGRLYLTFYTADKSVPYTWLNHWPRTALINECTSPPHSLLSEDGDQFSPLWGWGYGHLNSNSL